MRTTQYIGLTSTAHEFVKNAKKKEEIEICTGMFDEPIIGLRYYLPNNEVYTEIVQASPWSSGPMIFTCLQNCFANKLFEWKEQKPSNGGEFDVIEGVFYI